MATGMVLSVAQTLLAAVQCKELREVCSMFGYESELDELQRTVTTIKAVLLDAESKHQELTHEGRDWIESLKDAVYDVDDLIDEFRTMAQQRHHMLHAKVSEKVCRFFSRSNKFLVAFNTSHEIKKIKDRLENIAKNRSDFGFGNTYEPVKRRADTYSYVHKESIIGREEDKEVVVDKLLSEKEENIWFVSIVGIGGLGKTGLAQLVFNDDRIKSAFDLRLWVCVSEDFSIEGIFSKVLGRDGLKLEGLQREVRHKIEGKKYLLVLDDVWNENRNEWFALRDFLDLGGKGTRILVTSRLKQVARVLENNSMHWIQGLSDQNSWNLFKAMAFENGKEPEDSKLVEIAKEIVKKCVNVPLSIRVIGSLLYGQEKSKWLSFKSVNLSQMGENKEGGIMPILKFSYYHLTPSLKCCFSYCALFPKDYVIDKKFLINLWMAHGCLDGGLQDGRSIEDVGEEYFSTLLQRCFLQDIEKDVNDENYSCKMHDLIHDLAQEVAGKEFSLVNTISMNRKIRHISIDGKNLVLFSQNDSFHKMKDLRTIVKLKTRFSRSDLGLDVTKILAQCTKTRVLELYDFHIEAIPNTLCKLVHLRYLDLSKNQIKILPKSITKLLNLQVMNLSYCQELKELPKDLWKLVNLRQLDISGCDSLTHMPARLDSLTCLHTLTMFVLGRGSSNQVGIGQLQELKHLAKLRCNLNIVVREGYSYDATNDEGRYLVNMCDLKNLTIEGAKQGDYITHIIIDEGLLKALEPHCNVRSINIDGYKDIKLPYWAATLGSRLPLLVRISLDSFRRLRHLPLLSQLQHLKFLHLSGMDSVEYIEDKSNDVPYYQRGSSAGKLTFFQSLETLELFGLENLKGWWREDILWSMEQRCGQYQDDAIPSFPRLHDLTISTCPSMTSFPGCPHIKKLWLQEVDGLRLFGKKVRMAHERQITYAAESPSSSNSNDNVGGFDLESLTIIDNFGMLNNANFRKSLRVSWLHLYNCEDERLSDARIEHLANDLQHLEINNCKNLVLEEKGDEMMPWKALHNLIHLELRGLDQLVILPKGSQYLTSLQALVIISCDNLKALPEWLDSLKSLKYLRLYKCPNIKSLPGAIQRLPSLINLNIRGCGDSLTKRCKEPDGEDFPKIRHIRILSIRH